MGVFLRVLAVVYGLGGLVHVGNILGFGEMPWLESPAAWRAGDVAYGLLDIAAVIGLWQRAPWGVACFLLAATSQLVLYLGFPDLFAFTAAHRASLRGLVGLHVVTLLVFAGLWFARK